MACCALSTIDNPFDPFEDFSKWFLFDQMNNYKCSERVARRALVDSDSMSPNEIEEEIERIIDEIVSEDPSGLFIKVEIGKFMYINPNEYEKPTENETKSFRKSNNSAEKRANSPLDSEK